jgi:hypothetical protein
VAALLGGGAAAGPVAAEAARTDTPGEVTAGDLRRMSRDEVRAALARIRRQHGGSR